MGGKKNNCTSQQQSCQIRRVQVSVRWFAEQDEEGDMENTNHFLIFHPEVGWGSGSNQSWTGLVQLHLGCFSQRLSTQAGRSEGWHREKQGCVMPQGLKTICPKAAFPGAARGDRWCGAPQFPGRGSPTLHQTLDCRRWDIILHWGGPCTLEIHSEIQTSRAWISGITFLKDSVKK